MTSAELLASLGVAAKGDVAVRSPVDGATIGHVAYDTPASIDAKVTAAVQAFRVWREVPAPRRGELVRLFGEELRTNKAALGRLVSLRRARSCRRAWAKFRK